MSTAYPPRTESIAAPGARAGGGSPTGEGTRRKWVARAWDVVPNALVFGLLAAVFAVGHHTGWKLPAMSELRGSVAASGPEWCAEHLVPEEMCVECQTGLMERPKPFGFCRVHGVAECVACHPELAQVAGEPKLPAYDTAAAIALVDRPTNNSRNTLHERRVQFASAEAADKAGVEVNVVGEQPMTEAVRANGEIRFDPTRVAHLSSRAAGTVVHVLKIVGDDVVPGEVMALVDMSAIGQAKSDLLSAIVQRRLRRSNYERLKAAGIGVAGITLTEAKAALDEADVAFLSARQALVNLGLEVPEDFGDADSNAIADELRFLGIPAEVLAKLPGLARSANLYAVRAPFAGTVVAAESVVGEVVSATDVLYTVADPSRMWLTLAVQQEDARYVRIGQTVEFRTDDGGTQAAGQISWVSPTIDERTRTMQARVLLENREGRLRDKTFGSGRIVLREEPRAVVVPRDAVQATGDATFVFVRDRNYLKDGAHKVYHVRQVRTGARDDGQVEILAGVLPGEVIATKGSNVILSQLLRSNLGAGCGCHDK